ncbi:hypothetical protein [Actinomadura sp. DC4]|uniref:hypothetical protein n=1 Tax=Actinomadura sp. DC4 TaxID=3055069 RepID=UPI0025AF4DF6|nr:hypothetical protein [Actinomadura sp. DC4]MDN3356064.1 hypothetical protein [Actinomadura sp. DC4]
MSEQSCFNCERCTWNPGSDCGRADHPHCPVCGHCDGRHDHDTVRAAKAALLAETEQIIEEASRL